jgi:hypothetical protein
VGAADQRLRTPQAEIFVVVGGWCQVPVPGPRPKAQVGGSFLDERRKIIRSQQQRSGKNSHRSGTNSHRFKRPVYSARALNKERLANTTADRKNKDGGTDLPWVFADHFGCRDRFCKQEDKKKRVNEVDTRWV